ncbi:MAG: MFS transporter, partial [Dehalococcoidia bacterium]|nr:MFS transporter [Dehalococcoidia bacterium]
TVIMLFWTHDVWLFFVFAAAFGIGYGGEAGGFPILNRRYYGFAPVGSVHGFQMFGAGLGMALGGWIGGVIFDMMGNYDMALIISIVASVAGAVSILLLEPSNRLLIPDWEKDHLSEDETVPTTEQVRAPTSAGAD